MRRQRLGNSCMLLAGLSSVVVPTVSSLMSSRQRERCAQLRHPLLPLRVIIDSRTRFRAALPRVHACCGRGPVGERSLNFLSFWSVPQMRDPTNAASLFLKVQDPAKNMIVIRAAPYAVTVTR